MEVFYSEPIDTCRYTIKAIPDSNARQVIKDVKIAMVPESKPEWGLDAHGNKYIFGCNPNPHSYFKFRITGIAECGNSPYDSVATEKEIMICRHAHGKTVPGPVIKGYYEKVTGANSGFDAMKPIDKAIYLMDRLHSDYRYEKNCTNVKTSAEEALKLGKGVCQDYSHILISLLLLAGCSARYVTGFIIGEGESHAWVEVVSDGKWIGVDPTNNVLVDDSHIRIGAGREASECELNRGIMHGGGDQMQRITANVIENEVHLTPEKRY